MGVYASYIIPYKKGLLKLLQAKLKQGQFYNIAGYGDNVNYYYIKRCQVRNKYQSTIIIMDIKNVRDVERSVSASTWTFYYKAGIIEVDDKLNYYNNQKYHEMVTKFFEDILETMDDKAHNVSIRPDYADFDIYEDSAEKNRDKISALDLIDELPIELMTKQELVLYKAKYGSIKGYSDEIDIISAIHGTDFEKIEKYITTGNIPDGELNELMKCCVIAKNTRALEIIIKNVDMKLFSNELFHYVLDGKDYNTLLMLINNKYIPSFEQLYRIANDFDLDKFENVMQIYTDNSFMSAICH